MLRPGQRTTLLAGRLERVERRGRDPALAVEHVALRMHARKLDRLLQRQPEIERGDHAPARSPSGSAPSRTTRATSSTRPSREHERRRHHARQPHRPARSVSEATARSVSPSMLFRCTPVPGTTTPEPQPVEHVSEAALPSPSSTLIWVVPGRCGWPIGTRPRVPLGRRRAAVEHPPHGARRGTARARTRASRCAFAERRARRDARRRRRQRARRAGGGPRGEHARARARSARRPRTAAGSSRTCARDRAPAAAAARIAR